MRVPIFKTDSNGDPQRIGYFSEGPDGQIIPDPPDQPSLNALRTLVVVAQIRDQRHEIRPAEQPREWLRYLHKQIRSPYLWAGQLELTPEEAAADTTTLQTEKGAL